MPCKEEMIDSTFAFPAESLLMTSPKAPSVNITHFMPDSGASRHMTPYLNDLFDIVKVKSTVILADGQTSNCTAIGNILMDMVDDKGKPIQILLKGAMHVPGLVTRILSITEFTSQGHAALFLKERLKLRLKGSKAVITLPMRSIFFIAVADNKGANRGIITTKANASGSSSASVHIQRKKVIKTSEKRVRFEINQEQLRHSFTGTSLMKKRVRQEKFWYRSSKTIMAAAALLQM